MIYNTIVRMKDRGYGGTLYPNAPQSSTLTEQCLKVAMTDDYFYEYECTLNFKVFSTLPAESTDLVNSWDFDFEVEQLSDSNITFDYSNIIVFKNIVGSKPLQATLSDKPTNKNFKFTISESAALNANNRLECDCQVIFKYTSANKLM